MPTKEEMLQKITAIGTAKDDAERRNLLMEFQNDVGNMCDENTRLTNANATFEADNKQLREYNMQLFLRVGNPQTTPKQTKTEPDTDNLKYEDLFNEKGELK